MTAHPPSLFRLLAGVLFRPLVAALMVGVTVAAVSSLFWNTAHAQNVVRDPNSAHAEDDYAQVQRLFKEGQTAQALQRADSYIAAHSNDPQMRFVKAAALQVTGHFDEAQAILTQLTRDYPELAEPWNNLAVLYAARGQTDAARSALEAALRVDPDYATALENLGDLEIRLALRHYEQARKADTGASARLAPKIAAAQRLADGAPAPQISASSAQPVASTPQSAASQPQAPASQPASAAVVAASAPANTASGPQAAASSAAAGTAAAPHQP